MEASKMSFLGFPQSGDEVAWILKVVSQARDKEEEAQALGIEQADSGILSNTWYALPKPGGTNDFKMLPNPLQNTEKLAQRQFVCGKAPTNCFPLEN